MQANNINLSKCEIAVTNIGKMCNLKSVEIVGIVIYQILADICEFCKSRFVYSIKKK